MNNKFGVVIAAGGSGTRFGTDIPKQFNEIRGIPIIAHTISVFQNCDLISEIVVVTHKDYIVYCNDVAKNFGFTKIRSIISGGATRQQSVLKGLKELHTQYVLIHDAARPVITVDDITNCCNVVETFGACALGSRITDTVKVSSDGEFIDSTIDRSKLWAIQTPQCFERENIIKHHKNAAFENLTVTDDCMLAEHYGCRIKLVESKGNNIKITNYSDLAVAEALLYV